MASDNSQTVSRLVVFEQGVPDVPEILRELNWPANSPWLTVVTDEKSIKIEHIRDLQSELGTSSPELRLVVITPGEKITLPAQQALLKLLEEPPANTSIVIPVRSRQSVLPTIQSRCVVLMATNNRKAVTESPLWSAWSRAGSLREKVELTQQFGGKKEEVQQLLLDELRSLNRIEPTPKSLSFRQRLLECLEAVQGNVSPQLCLEKLLLT